MKKVFFQVRARLMLNFYGLAKKVGLARAMMSVVRVVMVSVLLCNKFHRFGYFAHGGGKIASLRFIFCGVQNRAHGVCTMQTRLQKLKIALKPFPSKCAVGQNEPGGAIDKIIK